MHSPKRRCGGRRTVAALAAAPYGADAPASPPPALGHGTRHHQGVHSEIVGSTNVPKGKYPFLGTMQNITRGKTGLTRHFCGGALITPTWFLTAAHCMLTNPAPRERDLRIVVGRTVLDKSKQGISREVARIVVDPDYKPASFDNDVALVALKKPIFTIAPISFVRANDTPYDAPGTMLTVAGWGNALAQPIPGGLNFPDRMREASVPVIDQNSCAQEYAVPGFTITAHMLCAGAPRSGVDAVKATAAAHFSRQTRSASLHQWASSASGKAALAASPVSTRGSAILTSTISSPRPSLAARAAVAGSWAVGQPGAGAGLLGGGRRRCAQAEREVHRLAACQIQREFVRRDAPRDGGG